MNRLICILVIISVFCEQGLAQCNLPVPPSLNCQNAPVLCDLDGYCSTLPNGNTQPTPNAFCGVIENSHFIAFVAGTPNLSLQITPSNCNQSTGMQGHILQTDNCQNFQSVSNCWDPPGGVGGATPFVLAANSLIIGEEYLLLLDGKGGDVCDYEITVLEGKTVSPDFLIAVFDPVYFCENEGTKTIEIEDDFTNGINSIYNWETNDGLILSGFDTLNIEIGSSGIYTITALDTITLCADTLSVEALEAEEIVVQLALPDTINCKTNFEVVLSPDLFSSGQNIEYEWRNLEGDLLGINIFNLEVDEPGEYIFSVLDNETGCQKSDTAIVILDDEIPIAEAGENGELNCVNPFLILEGNTSSQGDFFIYHWSTLDGNIIENESTLNPKIDEPGTYYLDVFNENNGCQSMDSVVILFNEKVPENAQFSMKQPCFGESDGILTVESVEGGNPPYYFSIGDSLFFSNQVFDPIQIGNYSLIVRDEIGCEWDTTFSIMELPELVLDIEPLLEIKLGEEIRLPTIVNRDETDLTKIEWTPIEDLSCTDCLNPFANPYESTIYKINVTDGNKCETSAQTLLKINKEACVFIPNAFSPNADGNNDIFFVNGVQNISKIIKFRVFNRWGNLVFERRDIQANDPNFGWDGTFRGEKLNSGVYTFYAEIEFLDKRKEFFLGDVTLIR